MSSHHIVREKQEPALLIMSLEGFLAENLGQLLEWSPTVLVAEDMYDHTESLGIKIDGVVTSNPEFRTQENTLIIPSISDQIEDALKFLVSEQFPSVNIVHSEFALKDYALFVPDINMVIFISDHKIFPVHSGFSKWQSAGEKIVLLHEAKHLQTSGLKHLSDTVLETEKDGFYTLQFEQPFLFISETI
jgi:thiamine pyrophosphokinase